MRSATLVIPVILACLCGCASTPTHPGWERFRDAARDAVSERSVWVPLAGAALLSLGSSDQRISEWAAEHTPVFGSQSAAERASDVTLALLLAGSAASSMAAAHASGNSGVRKFGTDAAIMAVNHLATGGAQRAFGRERPDASHDDSFPSRHASDAFAAATLIDRKIVHLGWSDKATARTGNMAMVIAALCAWGRVEASVHYPTDVLAGAAFGAFNAHLMGRLWPGMAAGLTLGFGALPAGGLVTVRYSLPAPSAPATQVTTLHRIRRYSW